MADNQRVAALEQKEQNGTITEVERQELQKLRQTQDQNQKQS